MATNSGNTPCSNNDMPIPSPKEGEGKQSFADARSPIYGAQNPKSSYGDEGYRHLQQQHAQAQQSPDLSDGTVPQHLLLSPQNNSTSQHLLEFLDGHPLPPLFIEESISYDRNGRRMVQGRFGILLYDECGKRGVVRAGLNKAKTSGSGETLNIPNPAIKGHTEQTRSAQTQLPTFSDSTASTSVEGFPDTISLPRINIRDRFFGMPRCLDAQAQSQPRIGNWMDPSQMYGPQEEAVEDRLWYHGGLEASLDGANPDNIFRCGVLYPGGGGWF